MRNSAIAVKFTVKSKGGSREEAWKAFSRLFWSLDDALKKEMARFNGECEEKAFLSRADSIAYESRKEE